MIDVLGRETQTAYHTEKIAIVQQSFEPGLRSPSLPGNMV